MLIEGKWTADWHPVQATDEKGGFVRQTSSFRHWVTPDGRPVSLAKADLSPNLAATICMWRSFAPGPRAR